MGKQYTCSYCGKILYSSQYVKKHEATHTGQKFKAVVCKYCGKTVEYTKVPFIIYWIVTFPCHVSAEKSRVDSHGREAVQVLRLPVPVHSAEQPQDTHEGCPQEGAAQVGIIYAGDPKTIFI